MTPALRRLREIFSQLPVAEQQTLVAFAEFLYARVPPTQPQLLPRPPEESVIAAIKRLSKSYPMLDKAKILEEASSLLSEHLLQGRDRVAVIDQLEERFLHHYAEFVKTTHNA
jgi:hypothetical protein